MLKLKFCFLTFFSILTIEAFSQLSTTNTDVVKEYQVVVPSPNVASLIKNIAVPVNSYSGQAEISINLFTLPGGQGAPSIPITLSYSTSGFNVNEKPSWVGAGWRLSGTGAIGRTIRDMPDNSAQGYFSAAAASYFDSNGSPDAVLYDLLAHVVDPSAQGDNVIKAKNGMINYPPGSDPLGSMTGQRIDSEPDSYSYSSPGGSGEFVFSLNKNLIKLSPGPDSIRYTGDLASSFEFTVTDGMGNQYVYADSLAERMLAQSVCDQSLSFSYAIPELTGWNLKYIKSSSKQLTATYYYADETLSYPSTYSQTKIIMLAGNGASSSTPRPTDETCTSARLAYAKRLSAITYGDYTVYFIADGNERLDLDGGHRLKQVIVMQGTDTIKIFDFYHSYFNLDQFLKLDSIVERSATEQLPPHRFYYDAEGPFPTYGTFDQDYWGFFNNAGNTAAFPNTWILEYLSPYTGTYINRYADGADRDPNPLYMTTGSLNRVVYPTGGYVDITYEPNRYSNLQGAPKVKRQLIPTGLTQQFHVVGVYDTTTLSKNYIRIKTIETCETEEGGIPVGCGLVLIVDAATNETIYSLTNLTRNVILPIDPGTYLLKMGINNDYGSSYAELEWYDYPSNIPHEEIGGGIRVKEISYHDETGNLTNKKKYTYTDATGLSSGKLFSPVGTYHIQNYHSGYFATGSCHDDADQFEMASISSSLPYPMVTNAGSYVGYGRVVEEDISTSNGSSNGLKVNSYYNHPVTSNFYPPAPADVDYKYMNGTILKEEYYASDLVTKKREVNYEYSGTDYLPGAVWGFRMTALTVSGCDYYSAPFSWSSYKLRQNILLLNAVTQTDYTDDGQPGLSTFKTTNYNHYGSTYLPRVDSVVESSASNAPQKSRVTRYYYPFNLTDNTSIALRGKNIISKPTFVFESVRDTLVRGVHLDYASGTYVNVSAVNILPNTRSFTVSTIPSLMNAPGMYFTQEASMMYDNSGRVMQAQFADGLIRSYNWDNRFDIPAMVALNATPDRVYYNGFEVSVAGVNPKAGRSFKTITSAYTVTGFGSTGTYRMTYFYRANSSQPWTLREQIINYPSQSFTTADASGEIDELRIHPVTAQLTTYTIAAGKGITSVQDPNNNFIFYEYDSLGRLITIRDDEGNIVSSYRYNYFDRNLPSAGH